MGILDDFVIKKGLDGIYDIIKNLIVQKSIEKAVDDYSDRYQKDVFESLDHSESYNWGKLRSYVENELSKSIAACILLSSMVTRHLIYKQIFINAYINLDYQLILT